MVLEIEVSEEQVPVTRVVLVDLTVRLAQLPFNDSQTDDGLHCTAVALVVKRNQHQSHEIRCIVNCALSLAEVLGVICNRGGRLRISVPLCTRYRIRIVDTLLLSDLPD